MGKQVVISIEADGEVKIDLTGFHGNGCEKVFQDFAGDGKVNAVITKREYHDAATEKERQKQ